MAASSPKVWRPAVANFQSSTSACVLVGTPGDVTRTCVLVGTPGDVSNFLVENLKLPNDLD